MKVACVSKTASLILPAVEMHSWPYFRLLSSLILKEYLVFCSLINRLMGSWIWPVCEKTADTNWKTDFIRYSMMISQFFAHSEYWGDDLHVVACPGLTIYYLLQWWLRLKSLASQSLSDFQAIYQVVDYYLQCKRRQKASTAQISRLRVTISN